MLSYLPPVSGSLSEVGVEHHAAMSNQRRLHRIDLTGLTIGCGGLLQGLLPGIGPVLLESGCTQVPCLRC